MSGTFTITVPDTMMIEARVHEGAAFVERMRANVTIAAANGIAANNIEADLYASATNGNVVVESDLKGVQIDALTGTGNVVLVMPIRVSAIVAADIAESGQVVIEHPAFPPATGTLATRYRAEVNGGLNLVRALSRVGLVVIRARE